MPLSIRLLSGKIGVSVTDYVRHLVIDDVTKEKEALPMVYEETNKRIGESLRDLAEGRYRDIDPSNEDELNQLVGLEK